MVIHLSSVQGQTWQQFERVGPLSLLRMQTDDLVKMQVVNDPFIVHNLRERAKKYASLVDLF